jgi:hypothetical protein
MPEKLLYRNARDVLLALSTSHNDIDDDEAGAAVGVAEEGKDQELTEDVCAD